MALAASLPFKNSGAPMAKHNPDDVVDQVYSQLHHDAAAMDVGADGLSQLGLDQSKRMMKQVQQVNKATAKAGGATKGTQSSSRRSNKRNTSSAKGRQSSQRSSRSQPAARQSSTSARAKSSQRSSRRRPSKPRQSNTAKKAGNYAMKHVIKKAAKKEIQKKKVQKKKCQKAGKKQMEKKLIRAGQPVPGKTPPNNCAPNGSSMMPMNMQGMQHNNSMNRHPQQRMRCSNRFAQTAAKMFREGIHGAWL